MKWTIRILVGLLAAFLGLIAIARLTTKYHTAEDLVQETFFRAHLHIEDYQSKTVKAWLFTVAYHSYIDHYRKQKRLSIVSANEGFSRLYVFVKYDTIVMTNSKHEWFGLSFSLE